MNYNEFNGETRVFLNKAMDVYSIIKDVDIIKDVKGLFRKKNYHFTKLDKKILALFIAGFLVKGAVKDIFSEYDDIKLHNLLSFANIENGKIDKLLNGDYSEFYEKNFHMDLIGLVNSSGYIINFITPEVIVSCLGKSGFSKSNILAYFGEEIGFPGLFFHEHPVFKTLENYTLMNGSVSKKDSPKKNNIGMGRSSFVTSPSKLGNHELLIQTQSQKRRETFKLDDNVWLLLDEIQRKFIGQEEAVEGLFYNIVNNQQLAEVEDIQDGQRSIIFLDGPTGTGKTAITREITDKLGIPFVATSATNYSSTGYKGGDITDILNELYIKANKDIESAQRGIVVLDEFDKIAYSRSGGLEMKRAVQQQLLDFLGGGKYTIHVGNSIFDMKEVEFDTSKLTFVCLGALTDLRTHKTEKKQSIGFSESSLQEEHHEYSITPQDLMGIGLERELVGRFNTYLHTNDYSRADLMKILRESTISPLIGFRKWIELRGKKLVIDEEVYDLIVEQAYQLNTGARSLQTVMNNIRTHFIKEVLRGNSETIHLDFETVKKVCGYAMNRKGRS